MKHLLRHSGYSRFQTAEVQDGSLYVTEFNEGQTETRIFSELEPLSDLPVITFDGCEGVTDTLRLTTLTRVLFPTLVDYQWDTLLRLYEADPKAARTESVAFMWLRWLSEFARQEPARLFILGRMTRDSNLSRLAKSVAKFITETSSIRHPLPEVVWPHPPSHVLGQQATRSGEMDTRHIARLLKTDLPRHIESYEIRPAQEQLAARITDALLHSEFLLAEAGTGTGKSMAYLAPAVYWAIHSGQPVVVSTHTKNLQEQLFFKDLPILHGLMRFRSVLVKGRANYLCGKKWQAIQQDPDAYLKPREREAALPLIFWSSQTDSGDISECTALENEAWIGLRQKVTSDSAFCQIKHCSSDCFIRRIRDEIRQSQLVVVNHALLFSDLVANRSILGDYQTLILDEAHHVEKIAQDYLGVEFSGAFVRRFVQRIFDRENRETGLVVRIRNAVRSSAMSKTQQGHIQNRLADLADACRLLIENTLNYLAELEKTLPETTLKQRYDSSTSLLGRTSDSQRSFLDAIRRLKNTLIDTQHLIQTWPGDESSDDFRDAIERHVQELEEIAHAYHFLADSDAVNHVFWLEAQAGRKSDLRFYAVPLDVGDILRDIWYPHLRSVIFTSATLSVGGSFDHCRKRLGLESESARLDEISLASPFDLQQQCRAFVVPSMPDPNDGTYARAAAQVVGDLVQRYRRNTLVLFTSYQMMNQCRGHLREIRVDLPLFVQGEDGNRTQLMERMKRKDGMVLFGTDSFWEGVDLPGEALEVLVITKLPFEVPSDPLVAAKMEAVEKAGGNSFFDYSIPEAVLKFRQGFGRLIRHRHDRGVAVVLDNRVVKKAYGRIFMNSIGTPIRSVASTGELLERMDEFLFR